jgi:hypothetical protein
MAIGSTPVFTKAQVLEAARAARIKTRENFTVQLCDMVQQHLSDPVLLPPIPVLKDLDGCPECAKRRAQTAARVAKVRKNKGAHK